MWKLSKRMGEVQARARVENFKAIHRGIGVAKSQQPESRLLMASETITRQQEELIRARGSKGYVGRFTGAGAEAFRVIVVGETGDYRR